MYWGRYAHSSPAVRPPGSSWWLICCGCSSCKFLYTSNTMSLIAEWRKFRWAMTPCDGPVGMKARWSTGQRRITSFSSVAYPPNCSQQVWRVLQPLKSCNFYFLCCRSLRQCHWLDGPATPTEALHKSHSTCSQTKGGYIKNVFHSARKREITGSLVFCNFKWSQFCRTSDPKELKNSMIT